LIFTLGFSLILASAACKTKEEKAAVNAERQMEEAAKKMGEAAAQMGATAAKNAANLGVQGAAAGIEGASAGMAAAAAEMKNAAAAMQAAQGGAKVALVDFRALKELLPTSIAGLPRKSASGEKAGAMGMGISQAEGVYGGQGGRIEVKLIDAGAMGAMFGAAAIAGLEIDKENDDGYERTTTLAGRKALEKYDNKTKRGELKIFVGGRFVVEIDGHDVPAETLQKAVASLDLAKLEALK
jgi:hypothetical protein